METGIGVYKDPNYFVLLSLGCWLCKFNRSLFVSVNVEKILSLGKETTMVEGNDPTKHSKMNQWRLYFLSRGGLRDCTVFRGSRGPFQNVLGKHFIKNY